MRADTTFCKQLSTNAAQPAASRIMVMLRMPVLHLLHVPQYRKAHGLKRSRQHAQARRPRQRFADVSRQRGDQVAGRDNGGQAQKTGQLQPYLPCDALRGHGVVEQLVAGAGADSNVGFGLVSIEIPVRGLLVQHTRMLRMGQANPVLLIQGPLVMRIVAIA